MTKYSTNAILLAAFFFNISLSLAAGTQFITGNCTSDADCADSCCGFNTGKCAGPIVAQERDGGCGFGDPEPNDTAAVAIGFTGSAPSGTISGTNANDSSTAVAQPSTTLATVVVSSAAATSTGTQFITGPCKSDADCADSCCGFNTGLCAGPIVAQERDGGCGFGDAQPNSIAAQKLGFTGGITG